MRSGSALKCDIDGGPSPQGVVIAAAVKSNMRSSYTLGENGRETAEFGAGSDPPKTQLGGNLFSAKIFLTPFLFL